MDGKASIIIIALVLGLAWKANAQVNCATTGAGRFADPSDTTCQNYTLCVYVSSNNSFVSYNYICPTTSVFNPNSRQCTAAANYICAVTTSSTTTSTTTTAAPSTSVCTADGFVADPSSTDCTSYIQCVNVNGVYTQTTYTCPTNTFYDPSTTLCESNYVCTTTTAATTFACSAAGRFANPADSTCQTYYMCVLAANGTYVQTQYPCPTTSVFSPTARFCTTSYTCPTSG